MINTDEVSAHDFDLICRPIDIDDAKHDSDNTNHKASRIKRIMIDADDAKPHDSMI